MTKKIAVVILNWNGKPFLEKFLPTIVAYSANDQTEVVVVDNASTDDSVPFLQSAFPEIRIIRNEKNYGFAEGYNKGLLQLEHAYFVLLNSDIEVTSHWLQPLITALDEDNTLAACQPKVLSYNDKKKFEYAGAAGGFLDYLGYVFCRGRIFDHTETDTGQYNDEKKIFWATGACLIIRADVFKRLEGFDNQFFAHMEEIDLCWRIHRLGYHIKCFPQSKVYHVGGGTLPYNSPFKVYLNFRNSLVMCFKNWGRREILWKFPIRLVLDGVAAVQMLFTGQFKFFAAVFRSHISFYSKLRTHMAERRNQKKIITENSINTISPQSLYYPYSIIKQFFLNKRNKYSDLPKR